MSEKDAYEKKINAELDAIAADIDRLKAHADAAEAEAQIEYQRELDELRAKRDVATAKLQQLKEAGSDAWEDMRSGLDQAVESLGEAVRSASSRFR